MRLFLVRHAIAEPRGPVWPDDALRPLTNRGAARMRDIAVTLGGRGVQVDRIWTSPFLRAHHTAELIAPFWGDERVPVEAVPELAPGHAPGETAVALASRGAVPSVAVVGHEPGLGTLAAWLIGSESAMPFKKGGVARIDFTEGIAAGAGTLMWLLTPKLILEDS